MNDIHERARPTAHDALRTAHCAPRTVRILAAVLVTVALAVCATPGLAQVQPSFLYTLSNFSGPLRYDLMRVRVDRERDETYLIYQNLIRVFNASGMEIFSFGDDLNLGQILDAAVDRNGDVIILSFKDARTLVTRCNYRGVPVDPIEIRNLPEGVTFGANRMVIRNDLFYFANLYASSVIVTDANGVFQKRVDFVSLLDEEDRKKTDTEMIGFTVDGEGSIFFTMPALFKVYKVAADGKVSSFGRPGSAPGRFGVLGGVAVDSRGNIVVADKLKCVIMVFDKNFNLLTEFGYRGTRPENLVLPDDIDIDRRDHLYISQARRRGVSVFALAGK